MTDSVSSPNGTVTINDDGNFVFTPTQHFFGATQISFTITDNAPGSPNEITVEKFLKVIPVNDAPLISLPLDVSSDYIDERSQAVADTFTNAPTKQASFSVAAGFDRFFTLSDFGYSDQEVSTMHSVLIQVPDPSIGVFMLGPGNYVAEGSNVLSDELLPDESKISIDDTNFVRISYDDINDGKFFFASVPDAVGRISRFEFKVTDTLQTTSDAGEIEFNPGLDSNDTGLFEFSITGAPKSLDESLKMLNILVPLKLRLVLVVLPLLISYFKLSI